MTERSYLSIREVLDLLVSEFPDVTISKIRFLESRGLIHPERTPSGYRKFYGADVERLRWILRQQREHFLPLKVIKGRLEAANGGPQDEAVEPSLFDDDCADPPVDPARLVGVGAHQGAEAAVGSGLRLMGGSSGTRQAVASARPQREVEVASRAQRTAIAQAGGDGPGHPIPDADVPWQRSGGPSGPPAGLQRSLPAMGDEPLAARMELPPPASGRASDSSSTPQPSVPRHVAPEPSPAAAPVRNAEPAAARVEQSEPTQIALSAAGELDAEPARTAASRAAQRGSRSGGRSRKPAPSKVTPQEASNSLGSGMSLTADELAGAAGVEPEVVAELEEYGLVAGRVIAGVRCYDEEALVVTHIAAGFRAFGIESRHLRTFKHAAEREAGLFSQVVTPLLRQRNPAARERAHANLAELASLGAALQAALVRAELRDLTGG